MTRAPTRSGLFVDLLRPEPRRILFADISEGLAKLNRWAGATQSPLSVAQHSKLVADLMAREDGPLAGVYGALHDAHEYIIGDLTEPTRTALARMIGPELDETLNGLRSRLDAAIHAAFDVDFPRPRAIEQLLAHCHARVVATEIRDLLADNLELADFATEDLAFAQPLSAKLLPYSTWVKADAAFKDMLNSYHAAAGIRRTAAFATEE